MPPPKFRVAQTIPITAPNNLTPFGLNIRDEVVGVAGPVIETPGHRSFAFLYSNGSVQDFGTLPNGTEPDSGYSAAISINDGGTVTGRSEGFFGIGNSWWVGHFAFVRPPGGPMRALFFDPDFRANYASDINVAGAIT